jgi:hypothetical protein
MLEADEGAGYGDEVQTLLVLHVVRRNGFADRSDR